MSITQLSISGQLKAAKALISDEKFWLNNGLYSESADNTSSLDPWDSDACKFCSIGALARVVGITTETELHELHTASKIVGYIDKSVGSSKTAHYNDTHTHQEVMLAWDAAIAMAEQDEQEATQ